MSFAKALSACAGFYDLGAAQGGARTRACRLDTRVETRWISSELSVLGVHAPDNIGNRTQVRPIRIARLQLRRDNFSSLLDSRALPFHLLRNLLHSSITLLHLEHHHMVVLRP